MKQSIAQVTLLVHEYDKAIDFYVNKLSFTLLEDSQGPANAAKRWVVIAPRA